jgi:hypothetical protein
MHVEIVVEEPSAVALLNQLMPMLLQEGDTWRPVPHRGKDELLIELPRRLKSYANRMAHDPGLRVIILMDADRDCRRVKAELEKAVAASGLLTKTTAPAGQAFKVLTRLAISELEAWFLGDQHAVSAAFPRVHPHHFKGEYQDCDGLPHTYKTLHRILQKGGYYSSRYLKVEAAELIAAQLDPARNGSASFQYFCAGLAALR